MKTVAFVPIKLNNERLPQKNTRAFDNGEPLISYILKTLTSVKIIDDIFVYCSSEEIVPFLPDNVTFLKRSPELDLSSTSFNLVLTSFADSVDADIYVLAHATAPFISASNICRGIEQVQNGLHDSALAVTKMQEFLWKENHPFNYDIEHIPRTQDLDPIYVETCGLYIYTRELIKEKKRRIGDSPYLIEVTKCEACDINTAEDFIIANAIFNEIIRERGQG